MLFPRMVVAVTSEFPAGAFDGADVADGSAPGGAAEDGPAAGGVAAEVDGAPPRLLT